VLPLTDCIGNLVRVHALALGHLTNQPVDRAKNTVPQIFQAIRAACVVDAADHVQPAGDLAVVVTPGRNDLDARQIDQLDGDRRGSDVDRDRVVPERGVARLNVDDVEPSGIPHDRRSHLPPSRPQAVCHFSDTGQRVFDRLVSQVALKRARQTIEI